VNEYSLAGYRVIEFPQASRAALREVAERLLPHKEEIVRKWIAMQFAASDHRAVVVKIDLRP